jgi:hypothetical protein
VVHRFRIGVARRELVEQSQTFLGPSFQQQRQHRLIRPRVGSRTTSADARAAAIASASRPSEICGTPTKNPEKPPSIAPSKSPSIQ